MKDYNTRNIRKMLIIRVFLWPFAVRKEEDQKAWYLRATIDTYYFNDLVENIRIGRTGEAYIINKAGLLQTKNRIISHSMEIFSNEESL